MKKYVYHYLWGCHFISSSPSWCIWKCRLQNVSHFVEASICLKEICHAYGVALEKYSQARYKTHRNIWGGQSKQKIHARANTDTGTRLILVNLLSSLGYWYWIQSRWGGSVGREINARASQNGAFSVLSVILVPAFHAFLCYAPSDDYQLIPGD